MTLAGLASRISNVSARASSFSSVPSSQVHHDVVPVTRTDSNHMYVLPMSCNAQYM